MPEKKKIDKRAILKHLIDMSDKDPFYLTKILVSIVGKNAGMLALRLGIYILIVFPFLTEIVGLTRGVAAITVLGLVVLYYSARGFYDKIKNEVEDGSGTNTG